MKTVLPKANEEFFRGPKSLPIEVRSDFVDSEDDDLYARKNNNFRLRVNQ